MWVKPRKVNEVPSVLNALGRSSEAIAFFDNMVGGVIAWKAPAPKFK